MALIPKSGWTMKRPRMSTLGIDRFFYLGVAILRVQ
jgi:hypothetical protein